MAPARRPAQPLLRPRLLLQLVAACTALIAAWGAVTAAAAAAAAGPVAVVLWSNTNSLAEIGSTSPGDLMAPERFATIAQRLVVRDLGDYLVVADGPLPAASRRASHLRALRPSFNVAASQTAFGAVLDGPDAPLANAFADALRRAGAPFRTVAVQSESDLAVLAERTNGAQATVYQVDLTRFQNPEAALRAVLAAFGPESAPFVGVYISGPQPARTEEQPTQMRTFRGRELRSVPQDLLTSAVSGSDGSKKIFEEYNFVSSAIWMGLVAVIVLLLILIPSILCTMEIQAPTQFEKKPLLTTAQ